VTSVDDTAAMAGPRMSVVVVTPTRFRQIRRTVESLAAQTIAAELELVVVAPEAEAVAADLGALTAFWGTQVVPVGRIANVDHAAAAGLLRGRAPVVASIEDHAFPEPDWAARVLAGWDAADPDCVAVGSTITNANPRSGLSWSNILLAYGAWAPGTPEGQIDWVAAHNITLKGEALKPLSNNLAPMMGREGLFLKEMRARGGRFRFAPEARIAHVNPSTLSATAALRFDAGRLYAARRASEENWGWMKRIAYVALGPLIPFVRYARMRRDLFHAQSPMREGKLGFALFTGLLFDAGGQMLGYVAGPGGAPDRLATFEMDRIQHLDAHDRALFEPA